MVALLITVTVALAISFLCSVLEAALFSARDTELKERAGNGERGAAALLAIKSTRLDDAISAILILNTVAHTIGAAMAGAQAAEVFGNEWVGLFSAVLTLLVLVVTEIIPKTLGASYASSLVPFVAATLKFLTIILAPLLYLTRAITSMIHKPDHATISRGEVAAMVDTATQGGMIAEHEAEIVGNALRLRQVPLSDVMTPRTVVGKVAAADTVRDVTRSDPPSPYTRLIVYREDPDDVIGYCLVPHILRMYSQGNEERTVGDFVRPIPAYLVTDTVGETLRTLVREGSHIALVRDEFGGMAGIVTLEDLIETLLGVEITDESDKVADLRELAIQLRDKRLKRKQSPSPGSEEDVPGAPAPNAED